MEMIDKGNYVIERHWYSSEGLRVAATIMRPNGPGPFPVVVWNHNSRIELVDGVFVDETHLPTVTDDAEPYPGVLDEGWLWFFPEGRGYAGSEGVKPLSLAPQGPSAVVDYLGQRATDTLAGIEWLKLRKDVDLDRMVMAGASHGGTTTLLAASRNPSLFRSLVAQAPGVWTGMRTPGLNEMLDAVGKLECPLLLQHFTGDAIIPIDVSRSLAAECARRTKRSRLIEYPDVPGVDPHFQFRPGNFELMVDDLMAGLAAGLQKCRQNPARDQGQS